MTRYTIAVGVSISPDVLHKLAAMPIYELVVRIALTQRSPMYVLTVE